MSASIPASSALKGSIVGGVCAGGHSRLHPEPAQCHRHDHPQQLHLVLWRQCRGGHGYCPEDQPWCPCISRMGLSQGIMPLISYNYASDNIKRMKHTLTFAAKHLGHRTGAGIHCLFLLCRRPHRPCSWTTPTIVEMGSRFLRGFCLGLPFLCVDFLAVGVFQASGLGRNALVFAILRKIVLEIPALFILNQLLPALWPGLCPVHSRAGTVHCGCDHSGEAVWQTGAGKGRSGRPESSESINRYKTCPNRQRISL